MMMAAALKKCYDKHTHFRKKVCIEEQRAQKNDIFLRERQVTFMIYDHFRSTGWYDEIQSLAGLFSVHLENGDIQGFDLRWKRAFFSTSDPPSDKTLEGLYLSELQDAAQPQTIMALYHEEIIRGGGELDYHTRV